MRSKTWQLPPTLLSTLLAAAFPAAGLACPLHLAPPAIESPSNALARLAATGRDAAAVAQLRESGPAGVEALQALATAEPARAATPEYQAALDQVCAQKDCAASGLYWYTDLAKARAAAEANDKPILSLRLLGRLDEELSCANSRFFRAVLYANEGVAKTLRERFVLHWQSERPVPKVSIDFGDGRRLEGTVTGNSLHYVLDSHGRLVDAVPGLYGPQAFLKALAPAETAARRLAGLPDRGFSPALRDYHRARLAAMKSTLAADLRQIGAKNPEAMAGFTVESARWGGGRTIVSAQLASRRALGKSAAELPFLSALTFERGPTPDPGEVTVEDIAALHRDDVRLDEASRRLLGSKLATWLDPRGIQESLVRFENLLARDSVRNEYVLHAGLHNQLAESRAVPDLAEVNAWVYSDLFLTPAADPWLGLAPREVFAVLLPAGERDAVVEEGEAGKEAVLPEGR